MTRRKGRSGVPASYALPAALAALFAVGTVAAAAGGRLPGTGVPIAAAIVVGVTALIAEPLTTVPLAAIGWLTVTGFSRPQTDVEWTAADEADLLATIEQNADRLNGLIGNLLDLSRLHTGSLEPFLRPTAIEEVAPVALRGLDAPVHMDISVPDDVPLVRADPGLLERVLANIFSNALRHSPSSRPPALRARQADETVVLEVVDRGPGVVGDLLKERIFEPFQRLNDGNAGVGLGLAVAKGFAEAMGGTIAAVDTPGGGLTIRVTLPVAHSDDRSVLGAGQ